MQNNKESGDSVLYLASLPERLPRAAATRVGGILHESSLVLLPEWARRSQVYQALIGRMLRITVEWVGGVKGIKPADWRRASWPATPWSSPVFSWLAGRLCGCWLLLPT